MAVLTESPLNIEARVGELRGPITRTSSFYVRNHFQVPKVSVSDWKLVIDGEVDSPRVFTYDELRNMKSSAVDTVVECAGNGRRGFAAPAHGEVLWGSGAVGAARWVGIPLRSLLKACKPQPSSGEVVFEGLDSGTLPKVGPLRYTRSLPLGKALHECTLVALRMNGRRLSREHGYPARLIVPGWYGMASVKWLTRVSLRSGSPYKAHFNGTKYVYVTERGGREESEPVTEMRVKSLITYPLSGQRVAPGRPLFVRGKAWSGAAPIARVEVNLGGGWEDAELFHPKGAFSWSSWEVRWTPERRGEVTLLARATDERGNVQPTRPFENKYQYGYNAVDGVTLKVT